MRSFRAPAVVSVIILALVKGNVHAITLDTVPVGNPGNPGEVSGEGWVTRTCGSVDYTYNIGKYEVTAGQYTAFLNAVATTDTYGLYNPFMSSTLGCKIQQSGTPDHYHYTVAADSANRPVNCVSWGDAARFTNWLHNGQPTGGQDATTTEDGAYSLNGATTIQALMAITRKPGWKWAISTEDEWYKAAYHKNDGATGNYFDYPTSSDLVPSNQLVDPDPGNNANFYNNGYAIGDPYYLTEVGAYENSESPYGTYDQGGNVYEWTETPVGLPTRSLRGGSGFSPDNVTGLHASHRNYYVPTSESSSVGFRVSQVPEPTTIGLFVLAGVGLLRNRRF